MDDPPCVGEKLTLTCTIYGMSLAWYYNGLLLIRYADGAVCGDYRNFGDGIIPDGTELHSVLATNITSEGFFECTSILDITSPNSNFNASNITCSTRKSLNDPDVPILGNLYCNYLYNVLGR